ncbi:MAG: YigZ family protein [Bacteroidales bacterium]
MKEEKIPEGSDTYKTILKRSTAVFRDRGSRFIAIADTVTSQEEVKEILEEHRKNYHDARHHCYAWMLGHERNQWRSNDDGEPSGTAGKPILGQINSAGLTNILVVVIRYFGGTLLGTSGLINAYRTAAGDAIANAEITTLTVKNTYLLSFPYAAMNDVMKIIKDEELEQWDQDFSLECRMKVAVRLSASERVISRLSLVEDVRADHIGMT